MSGSDSDDVFSYGGRKAPPPLQRAAAATAPLSDEAAQHAHLPRGGRPRKRARSGLEVVMLVDGDDEEEAIVLPSAAEPVAAAMGGNEGVSAQPSLEQLAVLRHNQQAQEALQKPATAEEESPPAAPTPAAEDIRLFLQHEQGRLTFKVKLTTKFRVIFDAFCEKTKRARASLRVTFDGDPVGEEMTPEGLGLEGEEVLDVAKQ